MRDEERTDKQKISAARLTGERALFRAENLRLEGCIFEDGESPLKHSRNIDAVGCLFKYKYPFWYSSDIRIEGGALFEMARAGIWYSRNASVTDTLIEAPKEFRKCEKVSLKNVSMPHAAETLWWCNNVTLDNVTACGDYFGMGSSGMKLNNVSLYGNYSFDGASDVRAENCRFLSKDCFWNADNITVRDSFISGEYFGWNSRNITLINCTIESLQGFCYIENLKLVNCRLIDTTLAFEYSSVDATISGHVDSIKNPSSGIIRADSIGEIILDPECVDVSRTEIITRD